MTLITILLSIGLLTILMSSLTGGVINRFRGGGMYFGQFWDKDRIDKLPGRALYPATLMVGLCCWIIFPWNIAIAIAALYMFWAVWAWGYLNTLGQIPDRLPTEFEQKLIDICRGNVLCAMYLRHMAIIPMFAMFGFVGIPWVTAIGAGVIAAFAIGAGYQIHNRELSKHTIERAEINAGMVIGTILGIFAVILRGVV